MTLDKNMCDLLKRFEQRRLDERAALVSRYPHAVNIECKNAMLNGYPGRPWVEDEREWCIRNITGPWHFPTRAEYTATDMIFEFRFERQEDAALFKLFWC